MSRTAPPCIPVRPFRGYNASFLHFGRSDTRETTWLPAKPAQVLDRLEPLLRMPPPNPRMQPTGHIAPSFARALIAAGDQWTKGLCGRRHESPQLIRMSLGGRNESSSETLATNRRPRSLVLRLCSLRRRRPRLGLPNRIQSITWSQDPALCAKALQRLRRIGDSLGWQGQSAATAQVLVFLVEPGLYAVVGNGDLNALSFFDRRWRYLVTLVGLG